MLILTTEWTVLYFPETLKYIVLPPNVNYNDGVEGREIFTSNAECKEDIINSFLTTNPDYEIHR